MRRGVEALVTCLKSSPYMKLLEYLGRLSIVVGAVSYLVGIPARHREHIYQAWQVVYSAAGRGGGGASDAVALLAREHVSLAQVDLANVFLPGIRLDGVDLRGATLWKATLSSGDLSDAKLFGAMLAGANLNNANVCGADLRASDLSETVLDWAVLDGADLRCVSHLTQEQLDRACATTRIALPTGYAAPKGDCTRIADAVKHQQGCRANSPSWTDDECGGLGR